MSKDALFHSQYLKIVPCILQVSVPCFNNDLEKEQIRARLIAAEQSVEEQGWVKETPDEILVGIKEKARIDGKL